MAWISSLAQARSGGHRSGIAAILLAVALLSLSDALVKLAGDRFGLAQLVFLRSLVAAPLLALGLRLAGTALRPDRPGWVALRSLCLAATWLCYYAALPAMSLSLAAACYYTAPAWMAVFARAFLGMAIGRAGWAAIALSLAGVSLAVDPRPGALAPALLLPLAAAAFYALAGIVTWSRCPQESAGALALDLNLWLAGLAAFALAALSVVGPGQGGGFLLSAWPALAPADWALAACLGAALAVVATAVAHAYASAPTPLVGLVDTAYLGFAALWAGLLLADPPSARETAGLALIAAGAILASTRPRLAGAAPGRVRPSAPAIPRGRILPPRPPSP